ncbi:MAG TPA: HAMP domain-containing sensor histidine kinase [Solirubrobacterales bacterium]|nr:HAMP domain-containing sensor histidine kinase [Solirubrobacterales bacterium]
MATAKKRTGAPLRRLVHPRSWPVRWRLSAVSAALTFLILLMFGGAIGQIATQRIRDDFNNEVRSAVQILAGQVRIVYPVLGEPRAEIGPQLNAFVLPDDASARIFDIRGNLIEENRGAEPLGPPQEGLSDYQGKRVATEQVINEEGQPTGFVQYGRSLEHVDSTVGRVWFLIVTGIIAGTVLAILAGVAIASRAMRPVSSLTATAREIAMTRDPSQRMPEPPVDDEVGELADTLDQMLRSLDEARGERESAMQRQREFVADASHELRTPLTSVLANLELLQASMQQAGQAEDREIVDSALRSSKRMNRLVGDLLLLARADAGRLGTHRRCDLAEIAGEAAAEAAPLLGERELVIDNDRPLRVEGNADELHRLVLNLLDNAAHHTPEDARIELTLREDGNDAVVEVADNGAGIPAEVRDQIFGRFVRGVGPADTNAGTGTGLGLAIVSAVAASHGGSVIVSDSSSGGALFRARIPMGAPQPAKSNLLEPL